MTIPLQEALGDRRAKNTPVLGAKVRVGSQGVTVWDKGLHLCDRTNRCLDRGGHLEPSTPRAGWGRHCARRREVVNVLSHSASLCPSSMDARKMTKATELRDRILDPDQREAALDEILDSGASDCDELGVLALDDPRSDVRILALKIFGAHSLFGVSGWFFDSYGRIPCISIGEGRGSLSSSTPSHFAILTDSST